MVARLLRERAAGPRAYRNMLVFLAPDKARLEELRDAARSFLAWRSIVDEHEELNLDAQQRRHAETQRKHFDEAVERVPAQALPRGARSRLDPSHMEHLLGETPLDARTTILFVVESEHDLAYVRGRLLTARRRST